MANPTISPEEVRRLHVAAGSLRWRKPARGGRAKAGTMNKTEAAYAAYLNERKSVGLILEWAFEGITLKLATDCRFTPDFMVQDVTGEVQLHDCKAAWKGKAHVEDDARVKLRLAARLFPFRVFIAAHVNGAWKLEEIT